eukprot:m.160141 g.160141  ORF g.160141 m.160141 type:complete len:86 (+) comp13381_c0_seq1:760-1017(+)
MKMKMKMNNAVLLQCTCLKVLNTSTKNRTESANKHCQNYKRPITISPLFFPSPSCDVVNEKNEQNHPPQCWQGVQLILGRYIVTE